jgi:T-complex protein 1 subunit zeta
MCKILVCIDTRINTISLTHYLVAALQDEHAEGHAAGLDLALGEPMDPVQSGVYDSFRVLRNAIASATGIASNLLLCDEMLKARQMSKGGPPGGGEDGAEG